MMWLRAAGDNASSNGSFEEAEAMNPTLVMILVMAVPLIIWLGIFSYLLLIDRTLRKLEQEDKGQDVL
jgi:CcmD family protein